MSEQTRHVINLVPDESDIPQVGERLQAEVEQIMREVNASDTVRSAFVAWGEARERIPALVRAQRGLNTESARLGRECDEIDARIRAALIDGFASGNPTDTKALVRQATELRNRRAAINDALAYAVEHEQPRAQIAELRAHANHLNALAVGIEQRACERMARTVSALREVVGQEGALAFDPNSTLSGALLTMARQYSFEASGLETAAREAEQRYSEFCRRVR